ncbi:MAG: NAD-dependent epimerase/dehydratase family protein [Catalinimonas sp.]
MASEPDNILITGANGQLGTELLYALRARFGADRTIATDLRPGPTQGGPADGPFETLDVLDATRLDALVERYRVTQVYHLAAVLSARGEQDPQASWRINVDGLLNVLRVAAARRLRVYWPSSIAVFGPKTPRQRTPQDTLMNPTTVYGIAKQTGEQWCDYYHRRHGLDVRSLRYPGLIGHRARPGGGTTDYAVDIFYRAAAGQPYTCFLAPDTYLPMMYMPDAVRATLQLMDAPADRVRVRTSYNVSALSFSPAEVAAAIRRHVPDFTVEYAPDFRQSIADSWPDSVDDAAARADWGWQPEYNLAGMTADMLKHLRVGTEV